MARCGGVFQLINIAIVAIISIKIARNRWSERAMFFGLNTK